MPTGIRTPDSRLRRPLLYPAELWAHIGAGEGDRTLATGLEGRGSTTELHPQILERKTRFELATLALARRCSTTEPLPQMWWWEKDSNLRRLSQRIYSPPPLATREPHHLSLNLRRISSLLIRFQSVAYAGTRLPSIGCAPRYTCSFKPKLHYCLNLLGKFF